MSLKASSTEELRTDGLYGSEILFGANPFTDLIFSVMSLLVLVTWAGMG